MPKTELTKELERKIWSATAKMGTFGCFEVTIGFNQGRNEKQRVDFLTFSTNKIWRCYEIKISKSDFHSNAHNTFVGHYNYYVLTKELYEEVKDEIPSHIGVYVGEGCVKNPKKQELGVSEDVLKNSMIRSLYREFEKQFKSGNETIVANLNRKVSRLTTERDRWYNEYIELLNNTNSDIKLKKRK